MGGSTVGRTRGGGARAPRFLEAYVKFLIFTIGAPPPRFITFAYCASPPILMPTPAYAYRSDHFTELRAMLRLTYTVVLTLKLLRAKNRALTEFRSATNTCLQNGFLYDSLICKQNRLKHLHVLV